MEKLDRSDFVFFLAFLAYYAESTYKRINPSFFLLYQPYFDRVRLVHPGIK